MMNAAIKPATKPAASDSTMIGNRRGLRAPWDLRGVDDPNVIAEELAEFRLHALTARKVSSRILPGPRPSRI